MSWNLKKGITAWTLKKNTHYNFSVKGLRFYENKPLNFSEIVINQSVPFGKFLSF